MMNEWIKCPQEPREVEGVFRPKLDAIAALLGTVEYEWMRDDSGEFWVRRLED